MFCNRIFKKVLPTFLYKLTFYYPIQNKLKKLQSGAHPTLKNILFADIKISKITEKNLIYYSSQICNHNFDFLGTGMKYWGDSINWHLDIKSKYQWENKFYTDYSTSETMPGKGIDIKIPWEINRLQHLVTLGQAWVFTKDSKYSLELCRQLNHWIESNRFCIGINWTNTMEVSIRVINIIIALDLIKDSEEYKEYIEKYIKIIRQHGLFIENNLEIGVVKKDIIAANHYLANICGLFMIGLSCQSIPESKVWLQSGTKGLEKEIERMVLNDGFFFESSTSYHRLAVELFLYPLVFADRLNIEFSESYYKKLEKMLDIILYVTAPNGTVPQIGDNDDGRLLIITDYSNWSKNDYRYLLGIGAIIFNRSDYKFFCSKMPEEILWLFGKKGTQKYDHIKKERIELNHKAFYESGLFVMRNDLMRDYALINAQTSDKLEINGAHSHNDDLSFELWMSGEPIFVDPGTYCYTSNKFERNRFRSTGIHNTLEINGEEINKFNSKEIFKLKRKSNIVLEEWSNELGNQLFKASNDAFKNINNLFHSRMIKYDKKKRLWVINDKIICDDDVSFKSVLHSIKKIHIISSSPKKVKVKIKKFFLEIQSDRPISLKVLKSNYSPSYGVQKDSFIAQIKGMASMNLYYKLSPI